MKALKSIAPFAVCIFIGTSASAADLSPGCWPASVREQAEKLEAAGWMPPVARSISGKKGLVSAIGSPIAVQSGLEALRQGGTAADAAAAVALTQITTQLGSVVSYAGIMSLVYYDASTRKVYSMDAGYNSYRNETDPRSIPVADLGPLNATFEAARSAANASGQPTPTGAGKGRETLVPGFMAGIEAMHGRFGRLPFAELFSPAVWYAERGVIVSPPLTGFFQLRRSFLSRTPEGRLFLGQAGSELPSVGQRFFQSELAKTLREVARSGSRYMYTGSWAQQFVAIVQREGGKVALDDLAGYKVIWSEPQSAEFAGHRVYTAGAPGLAAYNTLPELRLAEALKLHKRPPYWDDAAVLDAMQRISDVMTGAPELDPKIASFLRGRGVDVSPAAQLTESFAMAVAPLLEQLYASPANSPRHSDAIVVIDKDGNIAAVTHTIYSVIWGETGIVVGGIPIPDSAGIQQQRLAKIKPGERVPHEMMQTIVVRGDAPILATAAIGSSEIPETLKVLLSVVGQGLELEKVQAAPPLLADFDVLRTEQSSRQKRIVIPEGAYYPKLVNELKNRGVQVASMAPAAANGIRGTVVAVQVDPKTGARRSVETPGVLIFGGAE
jgi:gamma-glutamyltranspeptidase/glutathione hydrolase